MKTAALTTASTTKANALQLHKAALTCKCKLHAVTYTLTTTRLSMSSRPGGVVSALFMGISFEIAARCCWLQQ